MAAALLGVDGVAVEVEVRISSQLPRVDIVGLPEAAVRESSARVRAAIASIGQRFPEKRVTVNLAPASLRKGGSALDLPIAVGILAASGAVELAALEGLGLLGELSLDGRLRPVRGALALTLAVRDAGCSRVIVPAENAAEAALAPDVEVWSAADLAAVMRFLLTGEPLSLAVAATVPNTAPVAELSDIRGQDRGKRALEVAAAGGHGMLLRGAPGCGKTMLARRLPGLLPELSIEEALEVTRIHSAAGLTREGIPLIGHRPFRAPHHTASAAGLLGGGSPPRPGEISLAHRGVLFLDELLEFERRTLEALRQVLELRQIVLARAQMSCVFPAHFQLVAAANPCPCGWWSSGQRDCRCDEGSIARYTSRVSGPLLDRIDLNLSLRPVSWADLDAGPDGESSAVVAARVAEARRRQARRMRGVALGVNSDIPDDRLEGYVLATPDARRLLGRAVERVGLSARGARRTLKVARTIADLAGEEKTSPEAVAEALSYRCVSDRLPSNR